MIVADHLPTMKVCAECADPIEEEAPLYADARLWHEGCWKLCQIRRRHAAAHVRDRREKGYPARLVDLGTQELVPLVRRRR